MLNEIKVGPQFGGDGASVIARGDKSGSQVVTKAHGDWFEPSLRGNVFMAHAIVTAPVVYTTAAGTGGPLLWNGTNNKLCSLLAVGFGSSVVTTVAASLGITGNSGQTTAPTTTTAIDSQRSLYIGGQQSVISAFRIGTVANAGNFFMPFGQLHTGALTVDNTGTAWIPLHGAVIIPPFCWASVAASATATTAVCQIGIIYEEINL